MNRVGKIVPPKRQILKDISLSFFPGAKIGVLGLNGAGKSTLLKIMAGVDTEIEGEAIPMPGIKIGYLPQEPVLDPEKTVRETVAEGLGDIFDAQEKLNKVYEAYADPDADFDALAAEQARLEAIIATGGISGTPVVVKHFRIKFFFSLAKQDLFPYFFGCLGILFEVKCVCCCIQKRPIYQSLQAVSRTSIDSICLP